MNYIIHDIEGIRKPIIEKYLSYQNDIIYLIREDINVIDWEQDLEDVNYDYDFIISFINKDNILNEILELKQKIEKSLPVNVKLLDEQIENVILNEAEKEVIIDFYINIKMQ